MRSDHPVERKRARKAKGATEPRGPRAEKKRGALGAKVTHRVVRRAGNLAVSFEPTLATQVRDAADKQSDGNVSAWLAEAARERLRLDAGWAYLRDYEARNGAITEEELREIDRLWPR